MDTMTDEQTELIERLTAALREQWEYNHAEHCGMWPHDGLCHWPLPAVLGGDPAAWRPYADPA